MKTAIVITIAIPVLFIMAFKHPHVKHIMIQAISKIEKNKNNISGIFGYIILFSIIGILSGETLVSNLLSGYLYGPFKGTLIMAIIYTIVTIGWSYVLSQSALEEIKQLETKDEVIQQLFQVKDELSERDTIELIMLSRLSPILPYHIITILWYSTGISVPIITGASVIGSLPIGFCYSYLGSLMPNPKEAMEHKLHISYGNYRSIISLCVAIIAITYGIHEGSKYIIKHHRAVKKHK